MKKQVTKQAFTTSIPVMAGYIVLGMGFGLLLHDAGYGAGWALFMAVIIYAGTMQYVGVSLLASGASILTAALTTLMVQARHLFYSISMIERYKGAGKYKPYMIFGLTDETYSLLSDDNLPVAAEDAHRYRFLVTMEFSMTALFVASLTEQWITMHDHIPALTGFFGTLLCLLVFGPDHFLIPALLLITLILTLLRSREEAQG